MRRLIAVPTVLLALAAAGCGSGDESRERPAGGAGPSGSHGGNGGPEDGPPSSGPSAGIPGQPVSCGKIPDALGRDESVALFADPGAGGTVGCAEAHEVMTEFFLQAPQQDGEMPGSLAVRGWLCQYESGPTGTWISTCSKDSREMHTEEPSGQDTGPEGPDEPGAPDESRLPSLPDEPSDPMDEPSTEEL
ncbi:hypothetical protein AB0D04_35270 [Streptomyces sp. NPDC048483]|uniref:hypothetical protein n=1 Tax=Streptomyces sp. NPDC048483 TaxID=3154927 RepID=UPI0034289301